MNLMNWILIYLSKQIVLWFNQAKSTIVQSLSFLVFPIYNFFIMYSLCISQILYCIFILEVYIYNTIISMSSVQYFVYTVILFCKV